MHITERKVEKKITFSDIHEGALFKYKGTVWMKAIPKGFITNSSVLKEVIKRGDGLAVSMQDGVVTAWTKVAIVEPLLSELNYWKA